jgi:carboxypeptidase family protein
MQIRFGGRLSVAFSCVLIATGARAAAPDAASAAAALRDIAVRIDSAFAARTTGRAPQTATADAAKRAKSELDALARAATQHGFAGDATFQHKLLQVRRLDANLERAAAAPREAAISAPDPSFDPRRTTHAVAGQGGARCATALSIAPGDAIETTLAAGSTLWLRIAPRDARFVRLDTMRTPLDTEITLFGHDCPASDADAVARNDDAFGLAAALTIDAQRTGGVRYARVRNLGRAGHAIARLTTAGAFIGRITDQRNGHGIQAEVTTVTADGSFGVNTFSDEDTGLYLLAADPGAYYLSVSSPYGPPGPFVPELYPDAPCANPYYDISRCDTAHATLLTLQDGQQLAGLDVALNIGGRIAGTIRDAGSGAPIPNASVQLYDPQGYGVNYGTVTDAAGRYAIDGLMTGTVYAVAFTSDYSGQIWNHIACGGPVQNDCNALLGTPIGVVRDQLSPGIDFALSPQAHVRATAVARDGSPLPGNWSISLFDENGNFYLGYSGYDGQIDAGPLPPGTYRVFASAGGYFGQIWNGIDCPSDCASMIGQGTPFTLASGGVADLSFSLLALPAVSGTITDASTHAPIPNLYVNLVSADPNDFGSYSGATDDAGHYTIGYAPPGSYYVFATSSQYLSTIYPDVPCPGGYFDACDVAAATAVTTVYGGGDITGIDIAMPVNGSISGRVALRVPDGMPLTLAVPNYESVNIYDSSGGYFGSTSIAADGSYSATGIAPGTYHAIARGDSFDQAYGGIDCVDSCDPAAGTPIAVGQSQNVAGIDFDPYPRNWIFGRVTGVNDAPLAGVAIDLWHSTDQLHCGVAQTDANGYYALSDAMQWCPDAHYLSTDAPAPYVNQVYDGIACPDGSAWLGLCSLAGGTNVPFPTTPSFRIANFELGPPRDPIFADGFER